MDNPVKDITGQVEVIYEKTISEIDQEEGQLEAQLDRLSRKKDSLSKKRPYIIVGAFTLGMLLTPPDVISQTLLAIPMWLLFELGLIIGRWYSPGKKNNN